MIAYFFYKCDVANTKLNGKIKRMIYDLISNNIYTALFIGLLLGGETALLPAMYLGISGVINLDAVIGISIVATAISDTFWYYLGRTTSAEKISSIIIFKKYAGKITTLSNSFKSSGLAILFFSKFVYGTRTVAQILCGVHSLNFAKYFFTNISGILALNIFFLALGITVEKSFAQFVESPARLWLALGTFVACAVLLQTLFKKFIWKKLFQS